MLGELLDDGFRMRPALLPLIERLHRGEPGRATFHGLVALGFGVHATSPSLRRMAISASTASAAPPPLSFSVMRARVQAWSSFSTVRMPLPMQAAYWVPSSVRPRALSLQTDS